MHKLVSQGPSTAAAVSRRRIIVYDHRSSVRREHKVLETAGLDINGFYALLHEETKVSGNPKDNFYIQEAPPRIRMEFSHVGNEAYELVTTDRMIVDFDKFNNIQDGGTLYLVRHKNQQLPGATEESISFAPHFHTLTEAGTYEYHASEGKQAFSFALAELIDNALSATSKNSGVRTIEIRMMFDGTLGKPALIVMDNGCGMTTKKLKNWAVYKLSKFMREDDPFSSQQEQYTRPDSVPRSLNSDISFFGVGGKQAVFFIGKSVRMITKSIESPDVHELILSEKEFKRKEANKEDIFSGKIRNRAPGDSTHVVEKDEVFLHKLIAEEHGKKSFTAVVITALQTNHIDFMKKKFALLTTELANIYHYYIHGPNGNDLRHQTPRSDQHNKLDILVTLREKPTKLPCAINLREVENDMETLYNSSAADTFEFRASTQPDHAKVEGIIRYHPFLFDEETYPQDPNMEQDLTLLEDDLDNPLGHQNIGRGRKAIFACFWNGRLIPSTTVSEFDWCSSTKRSDVPPAECYNRLSGVLFTDDGFKVTQNKLTFMDLELKVKEKDTIFTIVSKGQNTSRRGDIKSQFNQWLSNCHKLYDKQVQFMGCKGTVERQDKNRKSADTWTAFSCIKWENRTFKAGERVKSSRTQPVIYGTVVHFLLLGNHKGNVFGAGGLVEINHEPKALYNEIRTIPISKIDRTATDEVIKANIHNDFLKLPKTLKVEWPGGNPWPNDTVRPAGSVLGPIKVTILNGKEEAMQSIPTGSKTKHIMNVKLSLTNSGGLVTEELASHSQKNGFWFKEIDMRKVGKHTLMLNATAAENYVSVLGDKNLPSVTLKFTITAGAAETFRIEERSPAVRVGVPFDIPLEITDSYGHAAEPPFRPRPVLACSNLELSYTTVDDNKGNNGKFTIRSVKAIGKVQGYSEIQSFDIKVTIPGLKKDTQSKKINLRPGLPSSIYVMPREDPIRVENGTSVMFEIEVHDVAGNITANPKQTVQCQIPGLSQQTTDCSSAGAGQFLTKPINLNITDGKPQTLTVLFKMAHQRSVNTAMCDLLVLPSTRVAVIEVRVNNDENLLLKPNEKINWLAGGLLDNLFYKLFDEAGREVAPTDEIASKIRVNWADINMEDLVQGKLPELHVAKQVQDERFCQVFYQERNVTFSFIVVPQPGEPKKLKVTLPQSTVELGETLSGDISLELVDMYDNTTKSLTPNCLSQMNVEAEGLDKSAVTFTYQESSSSVAVAGVCFKAGIPGHREMSFTYQNYVEQVTVKVTPGPPAKLTLISTPPQPLQFLNGTGSSTPFVVLLSDEWGNPCDQTVEVTIKSFPPGLTVENSHHMDAEGKASFIINKVSGPKGYYELTFEGFFKNIPIPGPSVNLTVIPDPNKPVKLLVEYDKTAKLSAGQSFPVFSVTVVSEEGSPITTYEPSAVSMQLWKSESPGGAPPEDATEMKCSMPLRGDRKDCFYFRGKEIPLLLGGYIIHFSLCINNNELLFSDQIPVHVVSDQPVKLGPERPPGNPVVSCCEDIAHRTLVENMSLLIMDLHGNPAGQNLNGKVVASIICAHGERNQNLPFFEGRVNTVQFDLVRGKAHIPRLALMKNSPGQNGSLYILKFKPEVVSTLLDAYELPFCFFSDAQKQQMVLELTKKKDELTGAIVAYKEILCTSAELLDLLTSQRDTASQKEAEIRSQLRKKNVTIDQPLSISTVDAMISAKTAEAENIRRMQRRTCNIPDPFKGQQDVLGKVGHLALVQDDDVARVISWSLGNILDCVVTMTTEAAQKIHRDMRGKQQVLPLDSILMSDDRPLPHIQRGRLLFDPPGNPVLARDLLIYPQHEERCKILFKNLLKDTILIDDLNSANQYRRMVVRNHIHCPSILTRQGERVNTQGIFGGAQNAAPPAGRLKLFGAPLPKPFYTFEEQKELLTQYRSALLQKEETERDVQRQLDYGKENERQKQEMEEKMRELEEIDHQLASLQAKPERRRLQEAPGSSGIAAKRTRV